MTHRRIRVAIVAATAVGAAILSAAPAMAAPITCPNGQTAEHNQGTWYCQNNSDHSTGAGRHKGTGDKL